MERQQNEIHQDVCMSQKLQMTSMQLVRVLMVPKLVCGYAESPLMDASV